MEEVVGKTGYGDSHPTAGVAIVNSTEAIGDVYTQKPVTEADGCFAKSW
jgi:hypothetical protein